MITFRQPALLEQAFTHKSFHNENPGQSPGHNERLEFLGDAVLDLALSDLLMRVYPELQEGDLSKLRASLVNEEALAEISRELEFDRKMRLGRGETNTGGAQKPRLQASVFEAYIGAVYLDSGYQVANEFLTGLFEPRLKKTEPALHFERDFKTRLQERAQELHRQAPQYEVVSESGPDHDKIFVVAVRVAGQELAQGQGRSKKAAEQEAARLALEGWR